MYPTTNDVNLIGNAARSWLFPGQRGRVLAVVSRATYLLVEDEELVWLATAETPMHRRCVQMSSPCPRPAVDSAFTVKAQSIEFSSGANLDFRASQVWEAPAIVAGNCIEIGRLPERLHSFCDSFLARKTPVGFGRLIPAVLQAAENASPTIAPDDILLTSAWSTIKKITKLCLAHNFAEVARQADALVGFGEGLTPSGDDFLGGLFFARTLLLCHYPQRHDLVFDHFPGVIDAYRPRTNLISFNLLKDNAFGHAPEPLHRFGVALLTDQSLDPAVSAASSLTTLGHSSGWDLLTGFLAGMLLAFEN